MEDIKKHIEEKFGDIEFIEESHQYFINKQEYVPVSHVIKEYEPFIDWDEKAVQYAKKYKLKPEDVSKSWKLNNLKSTIAGTRTHEFGESYTNLMSGHPELICPANKPQYVEEFNVLIPTYPKEEAIKNFYDDNAKNELNKLTPIGAEFRLSTKYIKGARPICGTCDILFHSDDQVFTDEDSGYVIGDWKTNKSLRNDYARRFGDFMTYPFNNMINEPMSHYTLQFNLYQRMLESIGVKIIDRQLIWLKDDGKYELYHIPKIDDKIIDKVLFKGKK
jgi:hypothetical protein